MVYGVSRTASTNRALIALRGRYPESLRLLDIALNCDDDLRHLVKSSAEVGRLDLVINTAGMLNGPDMHTGKSGRSNQSIGVATDVRDHPAGTSAGAESLPRSACRVCIAAARVGSIADNRTGGW